MIQELPTPPQPKAAPRHPFLALSPEARRHLARVLLAGLEASQDAEVSRQTRHGAAGSAALAGLGAVLYQGWYQLTAMDAGPFALWYGGYLAVQAGIASHLAARGHSLGPNTLRWLLLAPAEGVKAARAWLFPERLRPDRLVLAGGILVAIRHPVSYHLLRRLYGRAYPQLEVDRAVAVLRHLGLVIVKEREGSTVLLLSPAGVALLHELGVPEPVARPRIDPDIAPHLRPIFVALDRPGVRVAPSRPDAPDQLIEREVAPVAPPPPPPPPVVDLPQLEPAEPMPWEAPEPVVGHEVSTAPAEDEPEEVVAETPTPVALPVVVAPEPEDTGDLDEDLAPEPRERRRLKLPRVPKRVAATAAVIAAVGVLAVLAVRFWPQGPDGKPVHVTNAVMPSSRGQALGFNGRGLMLSSYGGDLFLSIADRLDYKRPLSFTGFDMATTCGLKAGAIRSASMSPQGRFLWLEMPTQDGKTERCLVDLETKTVTHDLPSKNDAYALPALVGWVGESTVLLSEDTASRQADRWWALDVTTHQGGPMALPHHGRAMLLPVPVGAPLLVGMDMRRLGEWDFTTYWLDGNKQWQKLQSLYTKLPEPLRESEPIHAALSPDKRYMILTLRPVSQASTTKGSLVVVSLATGHATHMDGTVTAEGPVFWGPEVRGGRYRFFYNSSTSEGDAPWTGEVQAE